MKYNGSTWFDAVMASPPATRDELTKRRIRGWDAYFAQIRTPGPEGVLWLRDSGGEAILDPEVAERAPAPLPASGWAQERAPAPIPASGRTAPSVAAPPVAERLGAALRAEYEAGLTPKDRAAKIEAIRHLFAIGDPNGTLKSYSKTVPGLVQAVLSERLDGTPIPEPAPEPPVALWGGSEARPRRIAGRWSEPAPVVIEAPITLDAGAVDELLAGLG